MKYYICKPHHPIVKKFEALMKKAEELGIRISFDRHFIIEDPDFSYTFKIMDLEEEPRLFCATYVDTIPYECEYKICFQKKEEEDEGKQHRTPQNQE